MNESELDTRSEEPLRRSGRLRASRGRRRPGALAVMAGIGIGILLAIGTVLSFTRTDWGRERVLAYTLETLGGRLNGVLTIERLDGNLLTGARLYNLALSDHDGIPLALVDSAEIRYRLPTLIGGDVVITRFRAYDADINLFLFPGDTLWNYQRVLVDPDPDPEAPPGATLVERLSIINANVTIRGPWEPEPGLSPPAREAALRSVLDDPRWMVEEVTGGYLRTMLMDIVEGEVSEVFIGPDERGGTYLEIDNMVSDIRLWRDPPLEIRSMRGRLHLRDGIINYEASEIVLPDSRAESVGRIDLRGERPLYDVVITAPAFALADLRFLYPWLPEDPGGGTGSARVWLEDRPDGLLVLARDLSLSMPGTEIAGSFGLIVNESLRFVDVDLEADPLRVDSVERLFPVDLAVQGLVIGGAVIRGDS